MHAKILTALAITLAVMTAGLNTEAKAAPASYVLEPQNSVVGFETDFGKDKISGQMPVTKADLTLDFANVAASRFAVTLDASGSNASFPFAAQALKGPKVLDTAEFPLITFVSTSVKANDKGAAVTGNMTIRGVTRPATMQAEIWRQKGQVEGDFSRLTIRLTGAMLRSDFGATGWSDMVGDQVRLDIVARIALVK